MDNKFEKFRNRLLTSGSDESVVKAFQYYYDKLLGGETGLLDKTMISAPEEEMIISSKQLPDGCNAPLEKLAVIKLNGGLGTSMGLSKAKSLLTVKEGNTFLDIISRQIMHYRKKKKIDIPLLFMNSFNTSDDTLAFLSKFDDLKLTGLPLDFLQNRFPKINANTLMPFVHEDDNLTWNPPGHGEIYMVLKNSGVLDLLLEKGFRYIFISNSDNLGAVVNSGILQYMADNKVPFIMEVCLRTEMDKKGGHLAVDRAGRLILRESAQCPEDETAEFQDISTYRYFNTNNLWVDLKALNNKLIENDNFLELTPIMNHKTVDDTGVIQLESAMGAAINVFSDSKAVVVDRNRFVPVKKTNEFLAVLSDAYKLTDGWEIELAEGREKAPQVSLDELYYKNIEDFEERIALGLPSLINCKSLKVDGDIYFGPGVKVEGDVKLVAEYQVELVNKVFKDGEFLV